MENFWDFSVWGSFHIISILLCSLLLGHILKRSVPLLQASLIPTSVLGGIVLVLIACVYKFFTGEIMYDTAFFGGHGTKMLELITYHCLALGFIASALKISDTKLTKKRTVEIFDSGVTTVSTYLIQAILGFAITMVAARFIEGFFPAAGVLLPFGYGQGTGQALNYGGIYEYEFGFAGGKSFGLTIAALGFICASLGGVFHLQRLRKQGVIIIRPPQEGKLRSEEIQADNEIPMQESIDKLTVQIALIALTYLLAYFAMFLLGNLLPGMRSVIYGFNFLLGVLMATVVKFTIIRLRKAGHIHRQYINNFLLTRASNFFFDLMVISGIAAIRFGALEKYWGIILLLGGVGMVATYLYNRLVARTLFPSYAEEQFLVMYGMLTGTASTGIILLRELDGEFKTPAADNVVYQTLPAIVFGFPMMILATQAPAQPTLTMIILIGFCAAMNLLLFRSRIFRRRK